MSRFQGAYCSLPLRSLASALGLLPAAAAAQAEGGPTTTAAPPFQELRKWHLPPSRGNTTSIATGDVDGDGDVDLLLPNGLLAPPERQARLLLGDGAGNFTDVTATHLPPAMREVVGAGLGDVDGDGDLDAFVGLQYFSIGGGNRLFHNDGTGHFVDAGPLPSPGLGPTQVFELFDWDGDGDADLVTGVKDDSNAVLENDGSGNFSILHRGISPHLNTIDVAVGDVDADGDPDLVFANGTDGIRYYLNEGALGFRNVTFQRLPLLGFVYGVALHDLDGDGSLELVVATGAGWPDRVLRIDPPGWFRDATGPAMLADLADSSSLAIADVDRDGDDDLAFGIQGASGDRRCRLYLNDGAGGFSAAPAAAMPAVSQDTRAIALVDADGDGAPDLVEGNATGQQDGLFFNDGRGSFVYASAGTMPTGKSDPTAALALIDVDDDGDLDQLVASTQSAAGSGRNRLYLNDGFGGFADASDRLPGDLQDSRGLVTGDFDGDGDIDAVIANDGGFDRYYANDGTGTFADETGTRMPERRDPTVAIARGDVDGDGDLDLLLGVRQMQHRLYLNDGAGHFTDGTAGRLPGSVDPTVDVALADLDGDGDRDAVVLNSFGPSRVYTNDGAGTFTEVTGALQALVPQPYSALAADDVDGDRDVDLLIGGASSRFASYSPDTLLLNDGTGGFVDATAALMPPEPARATRDVAIADLDGDGDADLAFAEGALAFRVYLQDGGIFVDATGTLPPFNGAGAVVAVGDVDGDEDTDLVLGTVVTSAEQVLHSLRWQLDAPFLARVGRPYRLDVYARLPAGTVNTAIPILGTRRVRVPLPPWGTLGLDPASLAVLPPVAVDPAEGLGSMALGIPNEPSLVGSTFFAQALLTSGAAPVRLTNVLAETVIP
ncbi:MAG: VCBS repeat-containing protein [Planctomycetota bacterium]